MIPITSKEWLRYIRKGQKCIDELRETRDRLLDVATAVTANYSGEVVSSSRLSRKAEDYVEAASRYDEQIADWMEKTLATVKAIDDIDEDIYRSVLRLYYIDKKDWEEVAKAVNYTREWVCKRIHPAALAAFKVPETVHTSSH